MGYVKKNFDGEYLKYYNVIKSHGKASVSELNSYDHVLDSIKSLEWEGSSKQSICNKISQIDNICDTYYQVLSCLLKKAKITYGILYQELSLLKEKIDSYNSSVDDYDRINNQLKTALAQEGDNNE